MCGGQKELEWLKNKKGRMGVRQKGVGWGWDRRGKGGYETEGLGWGGVLCCG